MTLLIDGYNLLNVSGVFPNAPHGGTLEQAREALLDWLAESLTPSERQAATIVFDARQAPPGLPRQFNRQGIQIRFAHRKLEADDLIEELIRADSAPRQMTVVSSDHRLQRAAKRRKAVAIDSDQWCRTIEQRRTSISGEFPGKLEPSSDNAEVARWIAAFHVDDAELVDNTSSPDLDRTLPVPQEELSSQLGSKQETTGHESLGSHDDIAPDDVAGDEDLRNPFPPGYGEDVLNETDGRHDTI